VTSRRRSKTLLSLLAAASVFVTAGAVSATTAPPGTEPAGTEAAGTEAPADIEAVATEAPAGTEGGATATEAAAGSEAASAEGSGGLGEVGGSACGTPHGAYDDPGVEPSGEVRVAWNQAFYSFNPATNRGNAVANVNPLYLMNLGGFTYYDGDLNYVNNDQFGTCTIDSLDPLTITYRINEGVTWSDGVQVDAADMLLTWAAGSGVFNTANTVVTGDTGETAEADENGAPIVVAADGTEISSVEEEAYAGAFDPESGALAEGFTYKAATGASFDTASPSMALVTQTPVISDDGLALTLTWDQFYVDYPTDGAFPGVPAHITAGRALGIDDPAAAKQALIDAFVNNDAAAIKPISEFWNRGFDQISMPEDAGVAIGFGPYNLVDFTEDGTMTFEVNPNYAWGPKPQVATIVYRIIGDPTAAVQAMENEEIDIIQPQATSDILTQLTALEDRGIAVITGESGTYEHVDLAQDNGGPFDPATYGGDAETAQKVRQAFLMTIPRQEIIDRLIIPLNPEAATRDSLTQVPGSPNYEALTSTNGVAEMYGEVDIAGAQALLEEAGVATPIDVRFLYAEGNPRRASEYELIRDSAAQAGFNVLDGASITWGSELANTSLYDAALFGWQTSAIVALVGEDEYTTEGQNNFYGYSNPEVDALYLEMQTTSDPARQLEILIEVEQLVIGDAFGVPIFQHPGITAYNSTYVSGVSEIPLSPTVFWNVWEWAAAG
jgi:peptide/nickel transport system substrate-binding protein